MRHRTAFLFVCAIMTLILAGSVHAGGWMIVVLRDMPEYAIARQPFALAFSVFEAGDLPRNDLKPTITAESGNKVVHAPARRSEMPGAYTASLTLPHSGKWAIRISATGSDTFSQAAGIRLPELAVVAHGSAAPPAMSKVDRGERLFIAKDCVFCHGSESGQLGIALKSVVSGDPPVDLVADLNSGRVSEAFLKVFLANPRPEMVPNSDSAGLYMPNLHLSPSEIDALVAFIKSGRLK